jgi:hypothetical protein
MAQEPEDVYQDFVAHQFSARALTALNTMRDALVAAGVQAGRVTVEEVDTTNLRYRLTAERGARRLVCYLELTPVGIIDEEMALIITLYVEGNGTEITHSYTVGAPQKYLSQIQALVEKLGEVEATMGEVTVKAKAFLQI